MIWRKKQLVPAYVGEMLPRSLLHLCRLAIRRSLTAQQLLTHYAGIPTS